MTFNYEFYDFRDILQHTYAVCHTVRTIARLHAEAISCLTWRQLINDLRNFGKTAYIYVAPSAKNLDPRKM